ncbi:hypothetical protein [Kaistia terrae]|uniref:Uncharacterized protein n=1 Tax=Kaistia terrae TaxID=537017 RepID=A0ABW0PVC5_9HYPH|nr:hypothetical protein [Kaistia terrae]MCX5579459.1 hypothetical protein [Kaistia terrae]
MANIPRLFAGQLSPGDFRARISKPDQDASDPNLGREHIDFDTAWPFAGNIHAVVKQRINGINANQTPDAANLSPRTIYFSALPYVPCVKIFLSAPDGSSITWREDVGPNAPGAGSLTYEAFNDRVVIYSQSGQFRFNNLVCAVVFKIPARDLGIVGNDPHPLARMLMGKRGDDYGLYASRPGFDVRTCSKAQMIFSSDDEFTVINGTDSNSVKGTAKTATDNTFTTIHFSYDWKGYIPIVLFFCTFDGSAGLGRNYVLPADREINTWGGAYPASGFITFPSPGVGMVSLRRIGELSTIYYSLIVLDEPLPTG